MSEQESEPDPPEADALECLIEAGKLTDTLELLQSIVGEAVLHIGRDGLQTRVVDPANVCCLDVSLSPDAFADTGSGSWALGINLERFEDYLSKADDGTLVSLSFDTEKRRLRIKYDAVDAKMACIDPDTIRDEPDIPELDLPNTLITEYDDLVDGVDVADMTSDHLTIVGDEDGEEIQIRAEGDTDDIVYRFDQERTLPGTTVKEDGESIYSIAYFTGQSGSSTNGVLSSVPNSPEIELRFGHEHPTKFTFEFAGGDGDVLCLLAPRIQSN